MDNNNLFIAVLLSLGILVGFHFMYEKPRADAIAQQVLLEKLAAEKKTDTAALALPKRERSAIIAEGKRVRIKTPELEGSINLKGARIDDLSLVNYRESVEKTSPEIVLLSPAGSDAPHQPYYAENGWLGDGANAPTADSEWKADAETLTPSRPLRLTFDNGHGLLFERTIAVDDQFMFTITDRVMNKGGETVTLYPFGLIARHGRPNTHDLFIMHEGPLGVLDGKLQEFKYKDLMAGKKQAITSDGGWVGITDKYWLVSLIPAQDEKLTASVTYDRGNESDPAQGLFQTDYRGTPVTLAAGAEASRSLHMFAGAKRLRTLDGYETQLNIPRFKYAIDFGWFYFLTIPFLYLFDSVGPLLGNYGIAILLFTVMLKILTLPLSLKSYRSMAVLKDLQPQINAIQEKYKDDKAKASVETMELYKREKVNPLSGCLPNLIQIPIFFALYKILFVGIELRQAPFYGWIHDLSAPDPTSVLTAFGHLPFTWIPHLGIWPLLMGISMYAQQLLSPQPPDKSQARMFLFMPLVFTFMLANMASGLIIYWTWSNLLGLGQQWFIMHKGKKKV